MGATLTLRDALAAGARTALAHEDELHGPECSCGGLADAILSDPTFRLALTESIAGALHKAHLPSWYNGHRSEDLVYAAAIVAQMLP